MIDPTIVAGFVAYAVVMLAIGIAASRHMRSLDDFVLAGRRLGPWVAAISERASGESAWFLLGLPGAAYVLGFREYWSVIGIAAGVLVSWTFLAARLRRESERLGALTLPDYFELRFSDRSRLLRVFATLACLVFYVAYVAAQFQGAGKILQATFGVEVLSGMALGAAVVVLYTLLGGFLAVAWTDLVQGLLMAFSAVLLPALALIRLGGFDGLTARLAHADASSLLAIDAGKTGAAFLFGVAFAGLSWGFGYLGQPHLLARYMALRSTRDVPRAQGIAMGWVLLAYWGAPMIGIAGLAVLGPGLADPEQVMPLLAKELVPGWLAGLLIAGAVAAMMSTVDSQLMVATSAIVQDLWIRLLGGGTDGRRVVWLSRIVTLIIAILAFGLARSQAGATGVINATVAYAWTGLGSAFGPPLLLSLWWKGTTRWGALAGMVTGILATIAWYQSPTLSAVLDLKAGPPLVSFAVTSGVSLLTRPRAE